jgi:transposase
MGPEDLIDAANAGDLASVKALIADGTNVAYRRRVDGATALLVAALQGHLDIVKELLDARADVDAKSDWGTTALFVASTRGHVDVVRRILREKPQVNIRSWNGTTALIMAVGNGHKDVVEDLLVAGADANAAADNGETAIILAARNGYFDIVKDLLAANVDVDRRTRKGETALSAAQQHGHYGAAELLKVTAVCHRGEQRSSDAALIAYLKLEIAKLNRDRFGPRSERTARLLAQLELQLEELTASASEDELAAEQQAAKIGRVGAFNRRHPARRPFPAHLPRERIIVPGPLTCACCGGARLAKLGEDVTESLEVIPRSWKVIQTVREKFTCRDCESISQPPPPFHVTPRGWAGPNLLAMVLFEKFGQHQPLNRQAERYAREGVALSLSTLADQVGACTTVLMPLFARLEGHVMAADRLHGDDTTVPVLARGKTDIARAWVYVRDDRPFGGTAAPAALFHYSRDRSGEHPQAHLASYSGILQADAFAGYGKLYESDRQPGPIVAAGCVDFGTFCHEVRIRLGRKPA